MAVIISDYYGLSLADVILNIFAKFISKNALRSWGKAILGFMKAILNNCPTNKNALLFVGQSKYMLCLACYKFCKCFSKKQT